jgi:hypothetical protein
MGHPATNLDRNSEFEVVKDWNGIDQIVLKVPSGASVRVSSHFFFDYVLVNLLEIRQFSFIFNIRLVCMEVK